MFNNNTKNTGFKMHHLLEEVNFGVNHFSIIKKEELQKIMKILSDPYIMQLFYYNDHYVSYPENNPSVILMKLEKVAALCKGVKNSKNGLSINVEAYFELIQDKKNNNEEISLFHLEKIGEWVNDKLLNELIEDILLFNKNMIYRELFSDKKLIAHLIKSYTQKQIKDVELNKKNHLYSLNIFYEHLKKNVEKNIDNLKNKKEIPLFADESIHQYYVLDKKKVNYDFIIENESIYDFIDYSGLDDLYRILPKFFYYMLIRTDKIEDNKDKTIAEVYSIIERNIEGLKSLTPPHLREFNLIP